MTGTHIVVFTMKDGTRLQLNFTGTVNALLKNWWITNPDKTPARQVDSCLQWFEPDHLDESADG